MTEVKELEEGSGEPLPNPEETLKQELEELKDKYLRLLAESENQRKRLHKEKEDSIKTAEIFLVGSFLEPIDHFENALKFATHSSSEVKQWAVGFEMILGQLKEILAALKVSSYTSLGHMFDHTRHEAIDTEETEEAVPGTILEEYQKGYEMEGKTIRPAKVKVAKARG